MEQVLYYKKYYFKLSNNILYRNDYQDLKLSIYNENNELLKTYKVEYNALFSYKIMKTKVITNNILALFNELDYEPSVSKMFFNKIIKLLEEKESVK